MSNSSRLTLTVLRDRAKELAASSRLARGAVLQYRLRTGHPNYSAIVDSPEYRRLLERRGGKRPRILIATGTGGYLGAARTESMLAIALLQRGADVETLLCDRFLPACQEATLHWYLDDGRFAANGPSRMHCSACFSPARDLYLSLGLRLHGYGDWVSDAEKATAAHLASQVPFHEMRDFRYDGVAVGEHAIAGAIRFYARAYLEPTPTSATIARRYLHAAILVQIATRNLLRARGYDVAVFHHGIYVPQGLVGEAARSEGVRVVNWHVAYRKRCFVFSHDDTYHHTMMNEPTESWETMEWGPSQEADILSYLKSRWEGSGDWIHFNRAPTSEVEAIQRESGVDFTKPCIGLLTNVMWDAQLFYGSNAFPTMLDWVLKTIRYFATRPELQLLIRVHPAEVTGALPSFQPIVSEIEKAFPTLPSNVHLIRPESKLSTYAAMLNCNAALVYGTKTGVELAAMGLPIIVAGEAWIRNKGISIDVSSEKDYFALLDSMPLPARLDARTLERARRYAYHFFFRRMIPFAFTELVPGAPGFEFRIDSLSDLSVGKDPGLDLVCEGILRGTPFVFPAEQRRREPAA